MSEPLRILGIDPGLRLTGYGCVDCDGASQRIVEAGVFRLGGKSEPRSSVSERLIELYDDLRALLDRVKPQIVAVEAVFSHFKHPATAIVMGHARGVLLLAVRQSRLELIEIKPNEVKKSLTGFGHAGKQQMQEAIQAHFKLDRRPEPADMADALAIALCGAVKQRFGRSTGEPTRKAKSRGLSGFSPDVQAQIQAALGADGIGRPTGSRRAGRSVQGKR